MAAPQASAVAAANQLVALMNQARLLRASINEFVNQYNSEGYSSAWNAMATAAQNADGSLGTADGTPVTTHPITTAGMPAGRTATQLVAGVTFCQDYQKFLTNVAVATAQRSQTVDDLSS